MKRALRFLAILTAVLAVGLPRLAAAQCPEDARLRTQRELDLTDSRIEQAEMLVSETSSDAARAELQGARDLQARAQQEFAAQHCRIALDLTLRARYRASRAIEIVRGTVGGGLPDPGRVLTQLERTADVISRARERIEECDQERARAILNAATEMQRRAEASFAAERYLAAYQLTVSARERALRALRFCKVQENLHDSAERALKRTDEVIARAQDAVAEADAPRAQQALGRAIELQEGARKAFEDQRNEASLRLTQSARGIAQRAMRIAGGSL